MKMRFERFYDVALNDIQNIALCYYPYHSNMQCDAVITLSIFSQIPTVDTPKLAREDKIYPGVSSVSSERNLCPATVIAVLYVI